MDPMEIRKRTPVTERIVQSILDQTGEVGLDYKNNVNAYSWRTFELVFPWMTRVLALFNYGPKIAFGWSK